MAFFPNQTSTLRNLPVEIHREKKGGELRMDRDEPFYLILLATFVLKKYGKLKIRSFRVFRRFQGHGFEGRGYRSITLL